MGIPPFCCCVCMRVVKVLVRLSVCVKLHVIIQKSFKAKSRDIRYFLRKRKKKVGNLKTCSPVLSG